MFSHPDLMRRSRRNPETKVRWNFPKTLARSDFHYAATRVNELIRPMGMYRDARPARILAGVCGNRNARLRVILPHEDLSHNSYIMSKAVSCAIADFKQTSRMKELTKNSLIGSGWRIVSVAAVGASLWLVQPIASVAATPPAADAESRQLDFWVGNWTVGAPNSAPNAMSVVHHELDKCLLIESWDGGRGHKGENIFAYSADDKSWHGMFTDNRGRVHVLTGKEIKPGLVEFTGISGADQMDRVRVTKISDEKVVESWDKSIDHGATWKTEFRGEYSRKNS